MNGPLSYSGTLPKLRRKLRGTDPIICVLVTCSVAFALLLFIQMVILIRTDSEMAILSEKGSNAATVDPFASDEMAVDRGRPLLYLEEQERVALKSLPSSSPNQASPFPQRRPDEELLYRQALGEAIRLRQADLNFRIIIFAWKRRASLKRLCNSLLRAHYHGFSIDLEFHLDGGAHPLVIEYIDQFKWPHGHVQVNQKGKRLGLEKTIIDSWRPFSDKDYAFFFEDDIEVSPYYFEYAITALHRYIMPDGKRPSHSIWTERMVGISLYTPRYNEITMPPRDWVPETQIERGESQFLFQVPCSWGALYFPWIWRQFLEYYSWRRRQPEAKLTTAIPDSATRYWIRSWKKYKKSFIHR